MSPNWTLLAGVATVPPPRPVPAKPVAQAAPPRAEENKPRRQYTPTDEQKKEREAKRKVNAAARRREKDELVRNGEGLARGENPCTSEIDYSAAETQFNMALDRYKREKRRPFPTNREILWVLISLGYRQVAQPGAKDGIPDDAQGGQQAVGPDPGDLPGPDARGLARDDTAGRVLQPPLPLPEG